MRLLLFVFWSVFSLPAAAAQAASPAALDKALEALRAEHAIPAMAVAVVEDGEPYYAAGFGAAEPGTLFRIASLSKLFTAQAVMQLVEQQKLTLEDTIGQHLPAFTGSTITIRQLLTHTGGLKDKVRPVWHEDARTTGAYVAAVAGKEKHQSDGDTFAYSDTGFNLLGTIVSAVSGKPFDAYVAEHIFAPAGMTASGYFDGQRGVAADVAPHRKGKPLPKNKQRPYDPAFYPSEGLVTNVTELSKWAIATMAKDPAILAAASYDAMLAPQVKTSWGDIHMGLGWQVYTHEGEFVARHPGGIRGYKALLLTYPERGRAIIILTNEHDAPRFDIARTVKAILDAE